MRFSAVALACLLFGFFGAACPAQRGAAKPAITPEQATAQLRAAWSAALESQSLEGSVPLYAENALFFSPEVGRVSGREAISNLFVQVFALWRAHISMTSRSVTCSGSLCVDEGSYSEQLTAKGDSSTHAAAGDYVNVLHQEADGSWHIIDQIWTSTPANPALNLPTNGR